MLPADIINNILEYDGRWSVRIGKPILKIPKDDERYKILSTKPMIKINHTFYYKTQYGCETIVWFKNGSQMMYCNNRSSFFTPFYISNADYL